jgi:Spy/CpxP family protein refolding chaperone
MWAPRRLEFLRRRVHLDPQQEKELARALGEVEAKALPTLQRLRAERRKLHGMLMDPEVDPSVVREQIRRVSELQTRLDSLAGEGMLREVSILTPEQRRVYLRRAFRGERFRHPRRGPMGP